MTVRNFDCVDVVNYPRFFYGSKMGTSTGKVINFENVTLPSASGVTNAHVASTTTNTKNVLVRINQAKGHTCGNYTMNFVNTYMNGVLLDAKSKAVLEETLTENTTMKYTFKAVSNGFTPPQRQVNTVNYTATNKVYIGALLVHFDADVIVEGSTFYLPAAEVLAKLRTTVQPSTVTKNGMAYVAHTTLQSSGAASSVLVSGSTLTITPVAPSSTTNLIVQNAGLITREYEAVCYMIDLVQKDGVMYGYPTGSQYNGGICYNMTEEIKMYGAGTYKISMKAMCKINDGGSYTTGRIVFDYEYKDAVKTDKRTNITLTGDWVEYTYEVTVTQSMIDNAITFGNVGFVATGAVPVQYFAIKDMAVTKIS